MQDAFHVQSPRTAWLSDNWFPVGVLAVTALVGVGTIVSNVI